MSRPDKALLALAALAGLAVVALGVAITWLTLAGADLFDARYGGDGTPGEPSVAESAFLVALGAGAIVTVLVPLWKILKRLRRRRSGR